MSPTDTDQSFADPVLQRPYIPPTELTKEQIEKARLLIPTNYWGIIRREPRTLPPRNDSRRR